MTFEDALIQTIFSACKSGKEILVLQCYRFNKAIVNSLEILEQLCYVLVDIVNI